MLNDRCQKGFTLYEVAAAAAILFTAISIVLPSVSLLAKERQAMQHKIHIANKLHDDLELRINKSQKHGAADKYTIKLDEKQVDFVFTASHSQLKGCATWKNAKNKQETFCLYGYLAE